MCMLTVLLQQEKEKNQTKEEVDSVRTERLQRWSFQLPVSLPVEWGCVTLATHHCITGKGSRQHGNSLKLWCPEFYWGFIKWIGLNWLNHWLCDWSQSPGPLHPQTSGWYHELKAPTLKLHLITWLVFLVWWPPRHTLRRGPPWTTKMLLSLWKFQRFLSHLSRTGEKGQPNSLLYRTSF